MSSRTDRFLGGLSFGFFNMAVMTIVSLWLTPFLLKRLGQEQYGLWLMATQMIAYLGLLDLGVVALLPREVAYATGRAKGVEHAHDLPQIIGETAGLVLWQMPLVILSALAIWAFMPHEWQSLQRPFAIVLGTFVLFFPIRIFSAILQGLQDLAFLGKVSFCTWLLQTTTTVALILSGFALYSLAIGFVAWQLLGASLAWYRLRSKFAMILPQNFCRLSWDKIRGRLKQCLWVSLSQINQLLLFGTELIIIGKLCGALLVVPYNCTGKLITILSHYPKMVMQTAIFGLSEIKEEGCKTKLAQVCIALTQILLICCGAIVCLVLAVNQNFVRWWVGPGQYMGFTCNLIWGICLFVEHFSLALIYSLFSFGHEKRLTLTISLQGIITVGGHIIFVSWLGPMGCLITKIIGNMIFIGLNLSCVTREIGLSDKEFLTSLCPFLWRFLVAAGLCLYVSTVWVADSLIEIVFISVFVETVYVMAIWPVLVAYPLVNYWMPRWTRLRNKFGRVKRD